jgi:phycoerythrin-associated linker protein
MDIVEFFQQCAGEWMMQRTSRNLNLNTSEATRTKLIVEMLSVDEPEIAQICEQQNLEPAAIALATRISWEGDVNFGQTKYSGSNLVAIAPDPESANFGKLLSQRITPNSSAANIISSYVLRNDGTLVLTTMHNQTHLEERAWFASENFKVRTSLLTQPDGQRIASFCTEIRKIPMPATE